MKRTLTILLTLTASSCLLDNNSSSSRKVKETVTNSQASVSPGNGRVFKVNPIVASGNPDLDQTTNLSLYLDRQSVFITERQTLTSSCLGVENCIFGFGDQDESEPLSNSSARWAYNVGTSEFLQVNAFYHAKYTTEFFHQNLIRLQGQIANPSIEPGQSDSNYPSALPQKMMDAKAHWLPEELKVYGDCDLNNNAVYNPANQSVCLGHDAIFKTQVKFSQDPSVIYHEVGHAFVDVMLNLRNQAEFYRTVDQDITGEIPNFILRSDLGFSGYDEAKSINEGIADFFSFFANNRTHIGEWALGRFNKASRPMSENDPIHPPGISSAVDSRVAYPRHLNLNVYSPETPSEDVHFAGMITSHYLVALTEELQSTCSISRREAINAVASALAESLAELGDLTTKGNDYHPVGYVNMDPVYSIDWLTSNNPINYRTFYRSLAKAELKLFARVDSPLCPGGAFTQEKIEKLLDMYGLLLFRTYLESGMGQAPDYVEVDSVVNPANRIKTELLTKDSLIVDTRSGESNYFVFDDQEGMAQILEGLTRSQLRQEISPLIDGELAFNNKNGKISPGEFVGVHVNLFNQSNSEIGGVEILANDWVHFKDNKPCALGDTVTTSNGGVPCTQPTSKSDFSADRLYPVCFIELKDDDSTKWVSQEEYLQTIGLDTNQCLDPTQPKSCLIRSPKGADIATYSRIEAQKTWAETLTTGDSTTPFSSSNVVYFEVNPNIPQGTVVNCRLRARFTNCDDCYYNESNAPFKDANYAGDKPFKVINLRFTVTD